MDADIRTVYVTKYALTQGIFVHEVRLGPSHESWDDDKPFVYTTGRARMIQQFRLGSDAFFTEDEALVAAEKMRQKKLSSLAKSIEKLRNLEIKVKR